MPSCCGLFGSSKDNDDDIVPVKVSSHTDPIKNASAKALNGPFQDPWAISRQKTQASEAAVASDPTTSGRVPGTDPIQESKSADFADVSPSEKPTQPTKDTPVETNQASVEQETPAKQEVPVQEVAAAEQEAPVQPKAPVEEEASVRPEGPVEQAVLDEQEAPIESTKVTQPNSNDAMADQLKGAASGVTNTVSSGAEKASSGVQQAASSAQGTSSGTKDWDAMTEDQKKQTFESLPADKKKDLTYTEWISQGYHNQKENWMPWIEDFYLRWFTKDNKASYATKDALDKSKVTGIEQVDTLQDGVNHAVSQQVGQGGILQPVGDMASKEGVNRAERGGKDSSGSYTGNSGGDSYLSTAGGYASSAGGSVMSGAKSAGGYLFGGKKEEESK